MRERVGVRTICSISCMPFGLVSCFHALRRVERVYRLKTRASASAISITALIGLVLSSDLLYRASKNCSKSLIPTYVYNQGEVMPNGMSLGLPPGPQGPRPSPGRQQATPQAAWAPGMQRPIGPPPAIAQQLPFRRIYYKTMQKGTLISGQYMFWKHDPHPLVLVTDVFPDRIRGINLHYLTFRYVKNLLSHYCDKAHFGYKFIMHDHYIVNAFRTYKRAGLRKIQMLDCEGITKELNVRRSLNPQELKVIRKQIRQQLRKQVNPSAAELAKQYVEMISPAPGFETLPPGMRQDARRAFRPAPEQPITPQGTVPGQPASIPGRPASE